MFEETKLFGSREQSIVVQTCAGTDLTNVIGAPPTPQQRRQYRDLVEIHGQNWVERKTATGGYNCAGHVWASRRTCLTDPHEWRLILREDRYRRLPDQEEPLVGDLALYVNQEDDEIIHVAEVVALQEGLTPDRARIPRVLSKWGPVAGESLHFAYDVPYRRLGYSIRVEYWTDR